jgi:hypothetical protein
MIDFNPNPGLTDEVRARLERRRTYVQAEIARGVNGEYYQDLKSELDWLNRTLTQGEHHA